MAAIEQGDDIGAPFFQALGQHGQLFVGQIPPVGAAIVADQCFAQAAGVFEFRCRTLFSPVAAVGEEGDIARAGLAEVRCAKMFDDGRVCRFLVEQSP